MEVWSNVDLNNCINPSCIIVLKPKIVVSHEGINACLSLNGQQYALMYWERPEVRETQKGTLSPVLWTRCCSPHGMPIGGLWTLELSDSQGQLFFQVWSEGRSSSRHRRENFLGIFKQKRVNEDWHLNLTLPSRKDWMRIDTWALHVHSSKTRE